MDAQLELTAVSDLASTTGAMETWHFFRAPQISPDLQHVAAIALKWVGGDLQDRLLVFGKDGSLCGGWDSPSPQKCYHNLTWAGPGEAVASWWPSKSLSVRVVSFL